MGRREGGGEGQTGNINQTFPPVIKKSKHTPHQTREFICWHPARLSGSANSIPPHKLQPPTRPKKKKIRFLRLDFSRHPHTFTHVKTFYVIRVPRLFVSVASRRTDLRFVHAPRIMVLSLSCPFFPLTPCPPPPCATPPTLSPKRRDRTSQTFLGKITQGLQSMRWIRVRSHCFPPQRYRYATRVRNRGPWRPEAKPLGHHAVLPTQNPGKGSPFFLLPKFFASTPGKQQKTNTKHAAAGS